MMYRTVRAEEYLEAVYQLGELGEKATTSRLAKWLEVAPPSVSEMIQRLGEQGLVDYQPYRRVVLTQAGCIRASRLLRCQRLWEVFLYNHLHIPWHRIWNEACNLEHGTTSLIESHLERFLDNPAFCPHGYPIPQVSDQVFTLAGQPLTSLEIEEQGVVRRISEWRSEFLEVLESQGIMPGMLLTVAQKAPSEGLLTVRTADRSLPIALDIAQIIVVGPIAP